MILICGLCGYEEEQETRDSFYDDEKVVSKKEINCNECKQCSNIKNIYPEMYKWVLSLNMNMLKAFKLNN